MNMKVSLLAAPAVAAALVLAFVLVMGTFAMRSSSVAAHGSIELLRLHIAVAHMHDHLLVHSNARLHENIDRLATDDPAEGFDGETVATSSAGGDHDAVAATGFASPGQSSVPSGSRASRVTDWSGTERHQPHGTLSPLGGNVNSGAVDFVIVAGRR